MIKYFVILLILSGFSGTAFATDNQIIHTEQYQPDVELLPDGIIQYGESFTIHAWLPTYDDKPEELQYFVDVWSSDNNQIDSTLWFAKEDFVYEFDTTHPDYNITKGGTYFIKIEKANQLQRTGSFYKTLEFKINFPQDTLTPLKQFKAGVRIDKIQCSESLQTILKIDGTPACVKPDSIEKLREYGWTNSKILSDELVREKLLELTGLLEGGHVAEFNELRTELVAFVLLERVDAAGMNLDGINLKYTSLPGANLHNATLKDANIGNADLSNANLQGSDLKGADLSYTRLWGANLYGANLQDSNLEGASLRGADLTLANLQNANLENADIPITANLSAIENNSNPHLEPNTIIIYDVTENGKTRLSIAPHTLVMNLTDGNIVRFVNDGSTSVNIFDKAKGIWRFDDVKPSSQRVLTINSTGFYEILIQNSREGESGRIVVLDNDVNSLSISDRIKMGKAIISDNFRKYPELVSVGVGNGEIGVHVTINKKELELHDAKSYYHEKFSKIIPFDVPIIIEFGEPIRPE